MREERYHIALDKYDKNIVINMLVLVGAVKMSDRVVREMMGL